MNNLIKLNRHHDSYLLEVLFSGGFSALISYELLRVYTPFNAQNESFTQQAPLVTNKAYVRINDIKQLENGVIFTFDDGHQSNIYSTDYLYDLCHNQDALWLTYLTRSKMAQQSRQSMLNLVQID